jgi:hypothetical protein
MNVRNKGRETETEKREETKKGRKEKGRKKERESARERKGEEEKRKEQTKRDLLSLSLPILSLVDYVLFAYVKDADITKPNTNEVQAVKWVSQDELKEMIKQSKIAPPAIHLTPWFDLISKDMVGKRAGDSEEIERGEYEGQERKGERKNKRSERENEKKRKLLREQRHREEIY